MSNHMVFYVSQKTSSFSYVPAVLFTKIKAPCESFTFHGDLDAVIAVVALITIITTYFRTNTFQSLPLSLLGGLSPHKYFCALQNPWIFTIIITSKLQSFTRSLAHLGNWRPVNGQAALNCKCLVLVFSWWVLLRFWTTICSLLTVTTF